MRGKQGRRKDKIQNEGREKGRSARRKRLKRRERVKSWRNANKSSRSWVTMEDEEALERSVVRLRRC